MVNTHVGQQATESTPVQLHSPARMLYCVAGEGDILGEPSSRSRAVKHSISGEQPSCSNLLLAGAGNGVVWLMVAFWDAESMACSYSYNAASSGECNVAHCGACIMAPIWTSGVQIHHHGGPDQLIAGTGWDDSQWLTLLISAPTYISSTRYGRTDMSSPEQLSMVVTRPVGKQLQDVLSPQHAAPNPAGSITAGC
ncbi:hypothetical protein Vretimale_11688 [Volvox reticuliferus]|uniref:Uncharacterized protein n=1 Tax=Volvox reticuliferus TaxID=1737510 RepID=A0A8J4LR67_9CHLO|nr:hypothetical protein Vretifemale_14669 [Volvox reticuliferus]GIM07599.1 hypothetical protein Vretimale_11688 [Volvox reticuliferus]